MVVNVKGKAFLLLSISRLCPLPDGSHAFGVGARDLAWENKVHVRQDLFTDKTKAAQDAIPNQFLNSAFSFHICNDKMFHNVPHKTHHSTRAAKPAQKSLDTCMCYDHKSTLD